jgi:hypothetical protein
MILLLLLLTVSVAPWSAQSAPSSQRAMNRIDTLLCNGRINDACLILRSDSLLRESFSLHGWTAEPESTKLEYADIMRGVCDNGKNEDSTQSQIGQYIKASTSRFDPGNAGTLAHHAYTEMKAAYDKGDADLAHAMYVIANFLRSKHVVLEEERLERNARQLEDLLAKYREHVLDIKQQRENQLRADVLREADQLLQSFQREDRQTPAFRAVGRKLEDRYLKCDIELRSLKTQEDYELRSEFKSIEYTIGISAGAFYTFAEMFQPYELLWVRGNGGIPEPIDENSVHADNSNWYIGFAVAIDGSYYLVDNLSLDLEFMYTKIQRERPAVHPFIDYNIFIPGFASPIQYGAVACVVQYMGRIKTGLRMISGLGAGLTVAHAPEYREYVGPYDIYKFIATPMEDKKSIRAIFRIGMEYIYSTESVISSSLIVDASLRLSGGPDVSVFFIQPRFRISLLL